MKKNYWQIDGDNNLFDKLSDAKHHIWVAYTPNERKKYLRDTHITHVINEEVVSTIKVNVDDEGEVTYGRVVKY